MTFPVPQTSPEQLGSGHMSPEAIMMWEQLGRIGGVATGEAYQRTQKANETVRVDDAGTYVYVGYAVVGSPTSTAVWKIKRIKTTNVVEVLYAGGTAFYNSIWDNRASLSYS
jgi:hypothetical protein